MCKILWQLLNSNLEYIEIYIELKLWLKIMNGSHACIVASSGVRYVMCILPSQMR